VAGLALRLIRRFVGRQQGFDWRRAVALSAVRRPPFGLISGFTPGPVTASGTPFSSHAAWRAF